MGKVKAKILNYLREKNLHTTKQREVIIDAFIKNKKHVSVDEMVAIVKKKDSSVGSTTVFRMLKLLVDSGVACEVDMGDKITRYEICEGKEHHDHLICRKCGTCIEVAHPGIEKLQEELCRANRFKMEDHRLEIFGLCEKCNKED